jgi:hypothetical protein
MSQVWIVEAEHWSVPGIGVAVYTTHELAQAAAFAKLLEIVGFWNADYPEQPWNIDPGMDLDDAAAAFADHVEEYGYVEGEYTPVMLFTAPLDPQGI